MEPCIARCIFFITNELQLILVQYSDNNKEFLDLWCVCVCVRACVRACVPGATSWEILCVPGAMS